MIYPENGNPIISHSYEGVVSTIFNIFISIISACFIYANVVFNVYIKSNCESWFTTFLYCFSILLSCYCIYKINSRIQSIKFLEILYLLWTFLFLISLEIGHLLNCLKPPEDDNLFPFILNKIIIMMHLWVLYFLFRLFLEIRDRDSETITSPLI